MAKIVEEYIVIKVSKLVKDDASDNVTLVPADFVDGIEAMASEILADPTAIIEVDKRSEL